MFSIGLVSQFTIGGLSGVTHAVSPADTQQTDTYYIVAHFHYVLFGGSMFGIFGGIYYWFPKVFGRKLSEGIGKLHFWLMFVGFNLTFGPMHILGLQGMPRRVSHLSGGHGLRRVEPGVDHRLLHHRRLVPGLDLQRRGQPQERLPRSRPLGRPDPGVGDVVAAAGPQLRRGARGQPPRRVVAPQVHRGRAGPDRAAGALRVPRGRRRRALHRPRGGGRAAGGAHPPAVALVLADHRGHRPAADRLRPDLHLLAVGPRCRPAARRHLRVGPRAVGRPGQRRPRPRRPPPDARAPIRPPPRRRSTPDATPAEVDA